MPELNEKLVEEMKRKSHYIPLDENDLDFIYSSLTTDLNKLEVIRNHFTEERKKSLGDKLNNAIQNKYDHGIVLDELSLFLISLSCSLVENKEIASKMIEQIGEDNLNLLYNPFKDVLKKYIGKE